MTALAWDQIGERVYEAGVDRCVLFLSDGRVTVWNGITSIDDNAAGRETSEFYLDGVKFAQMQTPGDFSQKLNAFTYPDEFAEVDGTVEVAEGLFFHDQPSKSFSLSYRTRIGNDIDGSNYGYRLHILYNVMASPDSSTFGTTASDPQPSLFSWTLSGIPQPISGVRPTAHVSIDSRYAALDRLTAIETLLYGSDTSDPSLPTFEQLQTVFE